MLADFDPQELMRKVAEALADISKVESPPKMIGRRMTMLLSHKPGSSKKPPKPEDDGMFRPPPAPGGGAQPKRGA